MIVRIIAFIFIRKVEESASEVYLKIVQGIQKLMTN